MLPQVLLFSSDQQVADLILALLPEFGLEVEHCRDVFGAIERLTSRSYHLLVVDWKEQLEASFLLKTARELTVAKSTPAVAVVEQQDVSPALKVGADAVLVRPFTFEQARSTFAALPQVCREQPSPERIQSRQDPVPERKLRRPTLGLRTVNPHLASMPVRVAPANLSRTLSFAGYTQRPRRSSKGPLKLFTVAVAFTVVTVGVLSPKYRHVLGAHLRSAVQVSRWFASASHDPQTPVANPSQLSAFEVDEITRSAMAASAARRSTRRIGPEYAGANAPRVTLSTLRRDRYSDSVLDAESRALRADVPESLMVPISAMTSRPPETKLSPSPSNKWSLEPVVVPEETSRALLIRQIMPRYPEPALAAGLEGTIRLNALVGKDGSIHDLKLIRGPLVFGRAAFDAVKQWRYQPYRINGDVVEIQTFITVSFTRSSPAALARSLP